MSVLRGYTPVTSEEVALYANRQTLSKIGFPSSEIDKIYAVAEAGRHFVKWSKKRAKSSGKGRPGFEEDIKTSLKPTECDICGTPACLGIVKLTSLEQQKNIPSDWQPYALESLGSPSSNDYRIYIILPAGTVIDYQGLKVYVVCGNCRVVLGLKMTRSCILFHNREPGYGFVDFNRITRLIQKYKYKRDNPALRALSIVRYFDDVMHDTNDVRGHEESGLRGRGIDLHFYVTPPITESDRQKLKKSVLECGYFGIFQIGDIQFFPVGEDFTEFRVWCPEALFMIKVSDAPKFYGEYLRGAFSLIKEMLNSEGYKLCGFDPRSVYRILHGEEDLIPINSVEHSFHLEGIKLDEVDAGLL